MGTDQDWEKWGANDPYFGVYSKEEYRTESLDFSAKNSFFRSGEMHVDRVYQTLRDSFDPQFAPKSVLDFGCGVGRLVIPFARRSESVVGVDVSSSMLSEADKNCRQANVYKKVKLLHSGDPAFVNEYFELVHSYIVLQHISWRRGRNILRSLSELVSSRGFLAVHFYTSCSAPTLVRFMVRLRYLFPPANWVRNIFRRRPLFEPAMQLHVYDLEAVSSDLKAAGFENVLLMDVPTGSEFGSIFLFAQRA